MFAEVLAGHERRASLVALGSYARRALCPGSDVDLLLVHEGGHEVRALADTVWYPLWDAGLMVGHASRTVKEAVSVADTDVQVLTSMLEGRDVVGDPELTSQLLERIHQLARKRQRRVVSTLAEGADERRGSPIADLLEPNLKEGGGGLRDIQALAWAGWTLGDPGGLDALVERGYLHDDDPRALAEARELLLAIRVALHRETGGRSDDLRLQDQDAVAARVRRGDADALAHQLAAAARMVAWISSDVWGRLLSAQSGPLGRLVRRDRELAPGIVRRDGRATLLEDTSADGSVALRLAAQAATHELPVDRRALERIAAGRTAPGWEPSWDGDARGHLVALLSQGRTAIPVVEALDHTGIWTALFPEWDHVRSQPQRNAYHRFTVDRHLLEAVAECAALLDADGFDGEVAAGLDRPELLPLVALLHDIGKGLPGDHSEVGAELAVSMLRRTGFDEEAVERLQTVVRHHLLLADVATRRDLSEESTAARVARSVGDGPTLELLYLLTVGDSQATGPAAWNSVKAHLVRELFVKAHRLLEEGEVGQTSAETHRDDLGRRIGQQRAAAYLDAMPPSYVATTDPEAMVRHLELLDAGAPAVEWSEEEGGLWRCTVVAPDFPGMFAEVAGALSTHGLSVQDAAAHTRDDGMALEVFRVHDPMARLARVTTETVSVDVLAALAGELDIDARVRERARQYAPARRRTAPPQPPEVHVDQDASDFATVVEVHADDRVGLLFQVTSLFAELGLDVHLAKVSTIGDRVVDAFYVREADGGKVTDPEREQEIRHTLLGRLRRA